jgi:hypothetical protein
MAHKGRHYPVAFRRDFNYRSDVSSTTAFPRHWTVVLHSGAVPVYPIDGATFVCGGDMFVAPDELRWESPVQHVAGFNWQLTALLQFFQLPDSILTAHWQLQRLDKGLVSSWVTSPPDYFNPFGFSGVFARTLFNDFTVFPRGSFFYFSSTNPTGY